MNRESNNETTAKACSDPLAFVVGMARSGTTWISSALNARGDIAVIGESLYWGRNYVNPANGLAYTTQEALIALDLFISGAEGLLLLQMDAVDEFRALVRLEAMENFCHRDYYYTPATLFNYGCNVFKTVMGVDYIAEKTPSHLLWWRRIAIAHPDSKFILCVRNAYDCMLSYKHQGDRQDSAARRKSDALYHPIAYALIWKKSMLAAGNLIAAYPGQVCVIKNEEIEKDPYGISKRIEEFLALEPQSSTYHRTINSSFTTDQKPKLSSVDIFWMNLVARKEIKQYGHPIIQSRVDVLELCSSLIIFPFWVLRVLRIRVGDSKVNFFKYIHNWLRAGS